MCISKLGMSILGFIVCSSLCRAATINVVGPVSSQNVGDPFAVDIDITGITNLYAFQFDLAFNPQVLAAISSNESSFLQNGGSTFVIAGTIDNVDGTISGVADTLIGATAGVNGNGTLVTVDFIPLNPGLSTLNLQNVTLLDSTLSDITSSATTQNGSVSVAGSSPIPEPSSLSLMLVGSGFLVFIRKQWPTCL